MTQLASGAAILLSLISFDAQRIVNDSNGLILPKSTFVAVELVGTLSSEVVRNGDTFEIRVFEPVLFDNQVLIPVGAEGIGEVIHSSKANRMGMPGELIVAARFIRCKATLIPLSHLQFSISGRDRTLDSIITRSVFRYSVDDKGDKSVIPAGTRGFAKVKIDTLFSSSKECFSNDEKGKRP